METQMIDQSRMATLLSQHCGAAPRSARESWLDGSAVLRLDDGTQYRVGAPATQTRAAPEPRPSPPAAPSPAPAPARQPAPSTDSAADVYRDFCAARDRALEASADADADDTDTAAIVAEAMRSTPNRKPDPTDTHAQVRHLLPSDCEVFGEFRRAIQAEIGGDDADDADVLSDTLQRLGLR